MWDVRVKLHTFLTLIQMEMSCELYASASLDAVYTSWVEGWLEPVADLAVVYQIQAVSTLLALLSQLIHTNPNWTQ